MKFANDWLTSMSQRVVSFFVDVVKTRMQKQVIVPGKTPKVWYIPIADL
jgi:hypothetical protein